MFGSDKFQIRFGETNHVGVYTVDTATAIAYGTAMDRSAADGTKAIVGAGDFIGFLSKRVSLAGPTFEQMSLGFQNLDAKTGDKVTLIQVATGGQVEVENEPGITAATVGEYLLVTSGAGDITAAPKDTELSVVSGRWRVAQSGDRVLGRVLDSAIAPLVALNVRVLIELIRGNTVP
jgi:hypothetical protein